MNQPSMLSKQEILDYATRYVSAQDAVDFAHDNDLFCILSRKIAPDKVLALDEGWEFQGYGICTGYTADEQEMPVGKWLWMHFVSLATFPPSVQVFKLQPPHAVKGGFQNPQRTLEFGIVKINVRDAEAAPQEKNRSNAQIPVASEPQSPPGGKVLEFKKKPAKKRAVSTSSVAPPPHKEL
jgi:hypothetical protein